MKNSYLKFNTAKLYGYILDAFKAQESARQDDFLLEDNNVVYKAIGAKKIRAKDGSEVISSSKWIFHNNYEAVEESYAIIPVTREEPKFYHISIQAEGYKIREIKQVLQKAFEAMNVPIIYNKGKTGISVVIKANYIESIKTELFKHIKSDACTLVAEYVGYNEQAFELIDWPYPKNHGKLLLSQFWDGESEEQDLIGAENPESEM